MKVRRIPELESLRGLMALWVMLGHVYLTLPRADLPLLGAVLARNGEAVNVFIILSGFVIFNLLDHERRGFRPYIIRRFFRIFPAYLLLLLVSAALLGVAEAAFSDPLWRSARNDGRLGILADTRAHFEAHMLAHLLLLQGMVPSRLLPSAEYAILGQAWSISLEWQFYLVAPLCFGAIRRDPARGTLAVVAIATAAFFALRYVAGEGFLPAAVPYFMVGGASYFLWKVHAALPAAAVAAATPVLAVLAAMLGAPAMGLWCAVLGCVMLEQLRPGLWLPGLVGGLLRQPVLLWLGAISYSLYLVHMIPVVVAIRLMPPSLAAAPWQGLYLLAAVTGASLLLSALIFHAVERPGIALGQRLAGAWPQAA